MKSVLIFFLTCAFGLFPNRGLTAGVPMGEMRKEAPQYDNFLASIIKQKDPYGGLNTFAAKHGVLQQVKLSKEGKGHFKTRMEGAWLNDSVFMKRLVPEPEKGLTLDTVYEIESAKKPEVLQQWNLPSNTGFTGVLDDELVVSYVLSGICASISETYTMAVKPSGSFRFFKGKFESVPKPSPCPVAKTLFKDSDRAGCIKLKQGKGKTRLFVAEIPMAMD